MKISAKKKNLENLGTWQKSYSYSRSVESIEGEYRHFHYGDIHGELAGSVSSSELPFVNVKGAHDIASTGDIIFADASEDYDALGKASVIFIENEDKVISGLHTHRFKADISLLDSAYLLAFTQSPSYKSYMRVIGNGVSVLGISKTNLGKLEVPVPSLPEQKKIAEFFTLLDDRIEKQAEKVALLKERKKGFQQKIFNRELVFTDDNGESYPEWEEKKLKDITVFIKDGTHATHQSDPEGAFLLSAKNVKNNKISYDHEDRKIPFADYEKIYKTYQLRENDLLLTVVGTIGRVALIPPNFPKIAFQRSVGVLRFNDGILPDFMLQLFSKDEFQNQLLRSQVVSAQPGIYLNDIAKLNVSLPSFPEQKKIAEFFSSLDKQIELNENKLELLKEQKKGYLQGIFG